MKIEQLHNFSKFSDDNFTNLYSRNNKRNSFIVPSLEKKIMNEIMKQTIKYLLLLQQSDDN